jgi:hypothetical protein
MADADSSLDILIRTLAETVGAEKVQAALDQVKESADKSGEAHEEASKKVDKHELSHRQLHKVMHAINELVPGLGTAMQFTFGVTAGVVAVLVLGIKQLAAWMERIQEHYKKAAEDAAESWREQQEGCSKAKEMAADYASELKHVGENTEALKQKEEQELAVLKAIEEARKKILEAQEQAEMAAAKGNPVAEAEVQARYKRKKSAEELAAEEDEIAQKEANLQRERAAQAAAKQRSDKAQHEAQAIQVPPDAVGEAKRWLERHKDDLTKAQEEVQQDEAVREALGKAGLTPTVGYGSPQEVERHRAELKKAEAEQLAHKKVIEDYDREKKNREDQASKATTEYGAATKTVTDREAEVARDKAVHDIHKQTAAAVTATETASELAQAGFKPGSKLGQTLIGDIQAEEARAHGEAMTQAQAAGIHRLVASLQAAGHNQKQINDIIQTMMDLHKSHAEKLTALATALHQLRQNQATRTLPGGG